MESNLTRTEKWIAGVAFVAIAIFVFMFALISQKSGGKISSQFETANSINYKMARPEQLYSEYTLNGRELEQIYEGLTPEEKKLSPRKQALIAKAKLAIKKKEELKKKQTASAEAKAQILAKARTQAQVRQAQLAAAQKISYKGASGHAEAAPAQDSYQNYNNDPAPRSAAGDSVDAKKVTKKSFAEWRSLIFEKPTSENLSLFVAALRKNEVSMTEYQVLAQDLLDQTDVRLKALGLQALRSVPSLQSFSQLVHAQSTLPETYQSYVDQALQSYVQPQNLQYLNQALATRDKVVILKSLNLLQTNLTLLSHGDQSGFTDPRSRREDAATTLTMASFRSLIPTLTSIGSAGDQDLSGLAQQVMELIQSTNTIAQSN